MFNHRFPIVFILLVLLGCTGQKSIPQLTEAKTLIDQNKSSEARPLLESVEKREPRNAEVQYLLGWIYFERGLRSDALAKFGAAIQYDKSFFGGYNGMGALLMVQGNSAEALNYFKKAADRNPKAPEILANIAELNMQMGKPDDAEDYLTRAKALAPQLGDYDFLLAQHHYRRGNLDKAKTFLKKGAELPFKKKVLSTQIPCLRAGIETKAFEAKVQSAVVRPPFKNQMAQIKELGQAFDQCQKQDANHFDYAAEKSKVDSWLKQKKS